MMHNCQNCRNRDNCRMYEQTDHDSVSSQYVYFLCDSCAANRSNTVYELDYKNAVPSDLTDVVDIQPFADPDIQRLLGVKNGGLHNGKVPCNPACSPDDHYEYKPIEITKNKDGFYQTNNIDAVLSAHPLSKENQARFSMVTMQSWRIQELYQVILGACHRFRSLKGVNNLGSSLSYPAVPQDQIHRKDRHHARRIYRSECMRIFTLKQKLHIPGPKTEQEAVGTAVDSYIDRVTHPVLEQWHQEQFAPVVTGTRTIVQFLSILEHERVHHGHHTLDDPWESYIESSNNDFASGFNFIMNYIRPLFLWEKLQYRDTIMLGQPHFTSKADCGSWIARGCLYKHAHENDKNYYNHSRLNCHRLVCPTCGPAAAGRMASRIVGTYREYQRLEQLKSGKIRVRRILYDVDQPIPKEAIRDEGEPDKYYWDIAREAIDFTPMAITQPAIPNQSPRAVHLTISFAKPRDDYSVQSDLNGDDATIKKRGAKSKNHHRPILHATPENCLTATGNIKPWLKRLLKRMGVRAYVKVMHPFRFGSVGSHKSASDSFVLTPDMEWSLSRFLARHPTLSAKNLKALAAFLEPRPEPHLHLLGDAWLNNDNEIKKHIPKNADPRDFHTDAVERKYGIVVNVTVDSNPPDDMYTRHIEKPKVRTKLYDDDKDLVAMLKYLLSHAGVPTKPGLSVYQYYGKLHGVKRPPKPKELCRWESCRRQVMPLTVNLPNIGWLYAPLEIWKHQRVLSAEVYMSRSEGERWGGYKDPPDIDVLVSATGGSVKYWCPPDRNIKGEVSNVIRDRLDQMEIDPRLIEQAVDFKPPTYTKSGQQIGSSDYDPRLKYPAEMSLMISKLQHLRIRVGIRESLDYHL